jgi:hypothetical protein
MFPFSPPLPSFLLAAHNLLMLNKEKDDELDDYNTEIVDSTSLGRYFNSNLRCLFDKNIFALNS